MKNTLRQWLAACSLGSFLMLLVGQASAQTNNTTGNLRILVVAADWSSLQHSRTEAEMEQHFRDNFALTETYWTFHSYGKITGVTPTFTPRYRLSGPGPTAQNPIGFPQGEQDLQNAIKQLAVSNGYVLNDYDHIMTSMPSFEAARPGGFGALAAPGFGVMMPGAFPSWVGVIHELGHALGCAHAGHFEGGSSIFTGYGSLVDGRDGLYMMGSEGGALAAVGVPIRHGNNNTGSRTGINVIHSHRMNHLTNANVLYPTATSVVRLFDMGTGTLSPGKNVAAVVSVPNGIAAGAWWLSYSPKMAEHWSANNGTSWLDGINVHARRGSSSFPQTGSLDFTPASQGGTGNDKDYVDSRDGALRVGNSWTFPGTDISISPIATGTADGVKYIDVQVDFTSNPGVQGPFGGNARSITSTIQAEDFDTGGEDVAYNDTTVGNNGSSNYRSGENVDISENPRAIGWIANNEYWNYTVNAASGTYDIEARVASGFASASVGDLKVELDGVNVGTVSIGGTGGWNSFQTFTLSNVSISGGNGKNLRLTAVNGASFNFDWIRFVQVSSGNPNGTAFGGSARSLTSLIQVEDFNVGGEDVAYNDTTVGNSGSSSYRAGENVDIADGPRVIGWIANNEYWNYEVNATSGTYDIEARVSSGAGSVGDLKVELDGANVGTVPIGNTGGWGSYQTVTLNNVSVSGGNGKNLRLTAVSGGAFNIDWIRFVAVTPPSGGGNNGQTSLTGANVGSVSPSGTTTNTGSGEYTILGSGADIWGSADAFHFASDPVTASTGTITARISSVSNTNTWAKAGVHYRDSNAAGSKNVGVYARPDGQVAMQWRSATNGSSSWHGSLVGGAGFAKWVRLTKNGNSYTGEWSTNGTSWNAIRTVSVSMGNDNSVGLAVTSHNNGTLCTATFTNVLHNWESSGSTSGGSTGGGSTGSGDTGGGSTGGGDTGGGSTGGGSTGGGDTGGGSTGGGDTGGGNQILTINSLISLKGSNNKYVSSENGNASGITCNRNSAGGWEKFTVIDAGGGMVAFRSSDGNYISSENGVGVMTCNRSTIGNNEKFTVASTGSLQISLQDANGKYVSSENGNRSMTCNRTAVGGWEAFTWKTE